MLVHVLIMACSIEGGHPLMVMGLVGIYGAW
jgi:hypothetical protein